MGSSVADDRLAMVFIAFFVSSHRGAASSNLSQLGPKYLVHERYLPILGLCGMPQFIITEAFRVPYGSLLIIEMILLLHILLFKIASLINPQFDSCISAQSYKC